MSNAYLLCKAQYIKSLLLYFFVKCLFRHFSKLLVDGVLLYLIVDFSRSMACLGKTGFIWFSLFAMPAAFGMSDHSVKLCTIWKSKAQHHISIYMYFNHENIFTAWHTSSWIWRSKWVVLVPRKTLSTYCLSHLSYKEALPLKDKEKSYKIISRQATTELHAD